MHACIVKRHYDNKKLSQMSQANWDRGIKLELFLKMSKWSRWTLIVLMYWCADQTHMWKRVIEINSRGSLMGTEHTTALKLIRGENKVTDTNQCQSLFVETMGWKWSLLIFERNVKHVSCWHQRHVQNHCGHPVKPYPQYVYIIHTIYS